MSNQSNHTNQKNHSSDNIPALRFPAFTGEWEKKKVGELCDSIVPGRNKPTDFEGDIPWITTPDIEHNGTIIFSKKGLNISREQAKKIGSKIVPVNSIIISCVGDLGLSAIAGKEIVINQQLHAFLPKEKIKYRFLLYQLNLQKKYMDKVATKTAVPYMNKDNCNSIPISFPTLPEQTKIAEFFTAIDAKLQALKTKKQKLQQYKKGVMQQLFCQHHDSENGLNHDSPDLLDSPDFEGEKKSRQSSKSQKSRFRQEDGTAFPDWEVKKLGEVCEITIGEFVIKTKQNPNGKYPVFNGGKTYTGLYDEFNNEGNKIIISARGANAGFVNFQTDRFWAGNSCYSISTINETNHLIKYFYFFVKKFENIFLENQQAANIPSVSKKDAENFEILIPSLPEQTKIANFLSAIDEKINHTEIQIQHTQTWKKGLLQRMFV